MKRILTALAIAGVSLSFVPSTAQAQQSSGPLPNTGEMYDNCKAFMALREAVSDMEILKAGRCMGAIEAMYITMHLNCENGVGFPSSNALNVTSPNALAQAFVNYARDNPQEWQDLGYFGIGRAAEEYFPCPN
jgi:hypothetical protein